MKRARRVMLPWEKHTGCPTCKAKPGQRCVVIKTKYVAWEKKLIAKGERGILTTPHKARVDLYCFLWNVRLDKMS